jgi:hypothetical protein
MKGDIVNRSRPDETVLCELRLQAITPMTASAAPSAIAVGAAAAALRAALAATTSATFCAALPRPEGPRRGGIGVDVGTVDTDAVGIRGECVETLSDAVPRYDQEPVGTIPEWVTETRILSEGERRRDAVRHSELSTTMLKFDSTSYDLSSFAHRSTHCNRRTRLPLLSTSAVRECGKKEQLDNTTAIVSPTKGQRRGPTTSMNAEGGATPRREKRAREAAPYLSRIAVGVGVRCHDASQRN